MNNCLVTGAGGFVGRELCRLLRQDGAVKIKAVSRRSTEGPWDSHCRWDFENGVLPAAELTGIDTVFHLAGIAHDFRSGAEIDSLYKKVNTEATVDLAGLAARQGVRRFVFASSVKAGGAPPEGVCADEEYQGEPEGIYGRSKRAAELGILEIGRQTGMHVSIIRPALVYGPGVKGNLGMMLRGIAKGWFPPLPETGNIRTMVHVEDLARALVMAAEKEAAVGEIFIVTDGGHYSSRQIFNEMCLAAGREIPRWSVPAIFFWILARIGDLTGRFVRVPFDGYRYAKMFGNDCYTSARIETRLNFKPEKTLKDALPAMVRLTQK
ncbi:MAG: NAD-dependent epimerase/dehydratase family protein [Desulfobulbales bacterium]|nr:NAD-dependent epimerase/dehydratase family protein [Desulfobulbales bacterium]